MNWFRKGADGSFLWPGFGDNSRVLKWVLERVAGAGDYADTPIGRVPDHRRHRHRRPRPRRRRARRSCSASTPTRWREELPQIEEHYEHIGERLPDELRDELNALEKRLAAS